MVTKLSCARAPSHYKSWIRLCLIGESTDIATDHNLVMYMRYVLNGEVHSRFLGLIGLTGETALKIVDVFLKVLLLGVFRLKSFVV